MPIKLFKNKKRIYFDYAASAPVLPAVLRGVKNHTTQFFANPSSIHKDGVMAKNALENARQKISRFFGAHSDEIFFTSGGTESNALALCGVAMYAKKLPQFQNQKPHIVTTNIEHPSVLKTCEMLEGWGIDVTYIPVESDGLVSAKKIKEYITPQTILISVAYANSEIGVIQPIKEIAKSIRSYKKEKSDAIQSSYPLLHIDACQAISYLEVGVEQLGVDLMSWNGTKLGGPRGTGSLYVRRGTPISSVYGGGGQENNLRSGTENVAGIVGLSVALAEVRNVFEKENQRLSDLREYCFIEITKKFPHVRINGNQTQRLCNNVNISFPGFSSELLVLELDALGISVSAGSACGSLKHSGSHVLEALYGTLDEKKWGSIRLSFGRETKKQDIIIFIKALDSIFDKYKKVRIL
ncbi:MAG: cysteine desulfurase family protein [bacterium]